MKKMLMVLVALAVIFVALPSAPAEAQGRRHPRRGYYPSMSPYSPNWVGRGRNPGADYIFGHRGGYGSGYRYGYGGGYGYDDFYFCGDSLGCHAKLTGIREGLGLLSRVLNSSEASGASKNINYDNCVLGDQQACTLLLAHDKKKFDKAMLVRHCAGGDQKACDRLD